MAQFIINSTGTRAIRKSEIDTVEIAFNPGEPIEGGGQNPDSYSLHLYLNAAIRQAVTFEVDDTLQGIQAKGASILEQLEAE